ncbi:MAG TPA: beta-L-arabinofuranosidase domain-containing protein [Balneolaceae bacterium]|nr:beta-L-arabinofuranosidase domain-containing protein [Balneolaceae bacterium]
MLRREFLQKMGMGATMFTLPGSMEFAQTPFKTPTDGKAGSTPINFFSLKDVRLRESPFTKAMDLNGEYLLKLDPDRLLACFYLSEDLEPKAPRYGGWETSELQGHTLGHYLSACSLMYSASDDLRYKERTEYIVDELQSLQKKGGDGYIGGIPDGRKLWKEVASGKIEPKAFSLNGVWSPWYNLHKTYAGLRDAYWHTGNEQAKQVLVDFSDWALELSSHLSDQQFTKMQECEYGGMNEVMADTYGITGDKKYMKLAQRFNDKKIFDPLAEGRDELTGEHGNTQIPKIIGAAREYEFNRDERMHKVSTYFWKQVVEHRSYVNGGNTDGEHFGKLGHLHDRLDKANTETCNTYNMLKLTQHLMSWEPDVEYADYYERALYNHILASIESERGQVTYFVNMDPGFFKTFSTPFHSFWCCRGTGMENHTKYGTAIYMHDDSDLYVNLFIPSQVNWNNKGLSLSQQTKFPNSDTTKLKLNLDNSQKFSLRIRKPYWVGSGFQVSVNGKQVSSSVDNSGYVAVNRQWKNGDVIEVSLPMDIHVEPMPNDDKKVAIMYGPLVLVGEFGTKWMSYPEPIGSDQSEYFDAASVKVPPIKTPAGKDISEFITAVEDEPAHFLLDSPAMEQTVKLSPFYEVDEQRYTVYWDVA